MVHGWPGVCVTEDVVYYEGIKWELKEKTNIWVSECFQSAGDQVLHLGVDDSVFFALSLNDLQGVCGHAREYDRMCEFTHNITDTRARTVTQADHSCTLSWHILHFVMFLFCCSYRWSSIRVGTVRVSWKEYWSEEGTRKHTMEEGFQDPGCDSCGQKRIDTPGYIMVQCP
jgi:hypothetical protein